jgi:hypothetical protein
VVIAKGSRIELFGKEHMQIVAGVSKPTGGSVHTLYTYTIHKTEITESSLLDITKYIAPTCDDEDLVAEDWWKNIVNQEQEKKVNNNTTPTKKKMSKDKSVNSVPKADSKAISDLYRKMEVIKMKLDRVLEGMKEMKDRQYQRETELLTKYTNLVEKSHSNTIEVLSTMKPAPTATK